MKTPTYVLNLLGFAMVAITLDTTAATFTVTSSADTGLGSLRVAIADANSTPGRDQIHFNVGTGPQTIVLQTPLPVITEPVILDATTQPGHAGDPLIELSGENLVSPEEGHGLVIAGGDTIVRGFVINRFPGGGIVIVENGNNVVEGNFVGTDFSGSPALGNLSGGVYVTTANNRIGGTEPHSGNVISGNENGGLIIDGTNATNNVVQGNVVGLNATGTAAIGNTVAGVLINEAPGNLIGGTTPQSRNVLSGNDNWGVLINGANARFNRVSGNFIGTDVSGQSSGYGNGDGGVSILDASENMIGGAEPGTRNVISGNGGIGVQIYQLEANASRNRISGNYVGLAADGDLSLGNAQIGIVVVDGSDNIIGGSNEHEHNVVAANGSTGIQITGITAVSNRICGNWVGLDAAGANPRPNGFSGILVSGPDTVVGGRTVGERNVVSGNRLRGIHLFGPEASRAMVIGNYVGTDSTGELAIANGLEGILVERALACTLGGVLSNEGNVVLGNDGGGVALVTCQDTSVQGNKIGVSALTTAPLGNGAHGILIRGSLRSQVGGRTLGAGNEIAFSALHGVSLVPGALPCMQNSIVGNSIHDNFGLAIDLGNDGPTLNDLLDPDDGPNGFQNYPELLAATVGAGRLIVTGRLSSVPNADYWIDVHANPTCAETRGREGAIFVGSGRVRTDLLGMADFRMEFATAISAGQSISATATDASGNTSEFAECISVQEALALSIHRIQLPDQPPRIEIRWRDSLGDVVLEQSTQLTAPGSWTEVNAVVTIVGDERSVQLSAEGLPRFFRLRR